MRKPPEVRQLLTAQIKTLRRQYPELKKDGLTWRSALLKAYLDETIYRELSIRRDKYGRLLRWSELDVRTIHHDLYDHIAIVLRSMLAAQPLSSPPPRSPPKKRAKTRAHTSPGCAVDTPTSPRSKRSK